jgi:hypothetical protein
MCQGMSHLTVRLTATNSYRVPSSSWILRSVVDSDIYLVILIVYQVVIFSHRLRDILNKSASWVRCSKEIEFVKEVRPVKRVD